MPVATAWSFLTLDDNVRQYTGNEGYDDQLNSHYVFDSTVHNSRHVTKGDLAVLRDSDVVLGIGWIDDVAVSEAQKVRQRCPHCTKTGFKLRRHQKPMYRCGDCTSEFDEPTREVLNVRRLVADYSRTFVPVDGVLATEALGSAYKAHAFQHAIRELDLETVHEIVSNSTITGTAYWKSDGPVRNEIVGGFAQRLGRARIGQQKFREQLLHRFGAVCAFSGRQHPAALDAAHLYRYSDTPEHDTAAGLLLRRDLHSLFDRWLLAVDPTTWEIRVSPELSGFPELAGLDGCPLQLPRALRPRPDHLTVHYEMARTGW
jgi:ribosomal protein L37AE/L43A